MFIERKCDGCHVIGIMYGSYFCNEAYCNCRFHKVCAESPLEINHHPSHPEHPLLLTKMSPAEDGTPCDFCGQEILSTCYNCSTCKFKVDLICGTKPSPSVIEQPVCHDHTLVFFKKQILKEDQVTCEICKESISGPSYSCRKCNNVYFHLDCVHISKEVDHPCHSSHPLKIMTSESLIDDDDAQKSCCFCFVQPKKVIYHCSICNFTLCLGCTKRPPLPVVDDAKTHTHPLTLFSSKIKFTCKVAGMEIDSYESYICLKCDFVVSVYSVGIPRIININRHDHRISFTHHLGYKGAKCGICRESVSQYYGAYSCSICPNYVVHSGCAADFDIWDGVELEGIPETSEDIAPFKVMGDNLIRHFSHDKHSLLFLKDYDMVGDDYERYQCEACISPIGFGPVYSCQACRFVLHEKCAYFPIKKKLVFGPSPYKLENQDVHCSSISEPFVHNGHLHPLYFLKTTEIRNCNACRRDRDGYILTCSACNFDLCLYCATLPENIWHISDEHPLTIYYGGKEATSKNWCEVCEMELDSSKWFFICSDCGVTLHVGCVLGDFSRLTPNCSIPFEGREYLAILNCQNSRPFCRHCHDRCTAPVILQYKDDDEQNEYICSIPCLLSQFGS
ncbi:Cysteine/Histidine-rich C1 domain family protein [Raphanus sativus]|nr:Cysteine/Histidine-rich C1 domain family protein [Raphanus sativus]